MMLAVTMRATVAVAFTFREPPLKQMHEASSRIEQTFRKDQTDKCATSVYTKTNVLRQFLRTGKEQSDAYRAQLRGMGSRTNVQSKQSNTT